LNSLSTQRDVNVGFLEYLARLAAGVTLAVAVAGCVAMKSRTAEDTVKERAQARWDALVKGDVKAAYTFLSPGSRAVLTPEAYANSIRVGFWKSAVVNKVACGTQQACEAHVTIEYEFQAQRIKTPLRETWIREGTDWWYLLK
jgi:hypothetical protein